MNSTRFNRSSDRIRRLFLALAMCGVALTTTGCSDDLWLATGEAFGDGYAAGSFFSESYDDSAFDTDSDYSNLETYDGYDTSGEMYKYETEETLYILIPVE